MSEGDIGSGDTGGGGGGGSFWTSLPTILTASAVFIGAVVSAVVALRGGGDVDATSTTTQTTTSSLAWHSHFSPQSNKGSGSSYFSGDKLIVRTEKAQPMVVLAERDGPQRDVRMSIRARRDSGDTDYGVGFVCRWANAKNYYFLSVLSKGEYRIARYRKGDLVELSHGPLPSDADGRKEHYIDARCVGDNPVILTLSLDGREVRTVRDEDGIEEGNVGIRVGSKGSVMCAFLDFVLRTL